MLASTAPLLLALVRVPCIEEVLHTRNATNGILVVPTKTTTSEFNTLPRQAPDLTEHEPGYPEGTFEIRGAFRVPWRGCPLRWVGVRVLWPTYLVGWVGVGAPRGVTCPTHPECTQGTFPPSAD
jgi:hypothetical protein